MNRSELFGHGSNESGKIFEHVLGESVDPIAVRTLHDEEIEIAEVVGIPEDRHVLPAQVSCEAQSAALPVFLDFEQHSRRAKDVSGIPEGCRYTRRDFE